jgi:hypothetical protein
MLVSLVCHAGIPPRGIWYKKYLNNQGTEKGEALWEDWKAHQRRREMRRAIYGV